MNIYLVAFEYLHSTPGGIGIKHILEVVPSTLEENIPTGEWSSRTVTPYSHLYQKWYSGGQRPGVQIEMVLRNADLSFIEKEASQAPARADKTPLIMEWLMNQRGVIPTEQFIALERILAKE